VALYQIGIVGKSEFGAAPQIAMIDGRGGASCAPMGAHPPQNVWPAAFLPSPCASDPAAREKNTADFSVDQETRKVIGFHQAGAGQGPAFVPAGSPDANDS